MKGCSFYGSWPEDKCLLVDRGYLGVLITWLPLARKEERGNRRRKGFETRSQSAAVCPLVAEVRGTAKERELKGLRGGFCHVGGMERQPRSSTCLMTIYFHRALTTGSHGSDSKSTSTPKIDWICSEQKCPHYHRKCREQSAARVCRPIGCRLSAVKYASCHGVKVMLGCTKRISSRIVVKARGCGRCLKIRAA